MTELYPGTILEVSEVRAKSELTADHLSGATILTLYRTGVFPDVGTVIIEGVIYPYIAKDDGMNTLTLGTGLTTALSVDTEVFIYPDTRVKMAMVQLAEENPPDVRVPHTLKDALDLGVRSPDAQESVYAVMETPGDWVIHDVIDEDLVRDGAFLEEGTVPVPPPSDGLPPSSAPTLTVLGGIAAMHARWTQIVNADPVTYRLHGAKDRNPLIDGSDEIVAGVGLTGASVRSVSGVSVVPGGDYRFTVTVEDVDTVPGSTRPASGIITSTPTKVTGPDIAANAVTADLIVFNTAFGDALNVLGLSADWIKTGKLNADRVSIGSQPVSSLANSNMEDPYINPSTGAVNLNAFAGWKTSYFEANGGVVSQNTATPISGTRSMRLTFAAVTDGMRMITSETYPVAAGQVWTVTAKFRLSRTINHTATGEPVIDLIFHTSDGVNPPDAVLTAGVNWETVDSMDIVTGDTIVTLSGTAVVPVGHRKMQVSFHAAPANDALGGYSIDIDEVYAQQAAREFQVVDPITGDVVAYISSKGDATFHDANFTGTAAIKPTDTYDGTPLVDFYAARDRTSAKGLIAAGTRSMAGTALAVTTENQILSMAFTLTSDRAVRFRYWSQLDSTVVNNRFDVRLRYTYSAPGAAAPAEPTTTSPFVHTVTTPAITGTSGAHTTVAASEDVTFNGDMLNQNMPAGNYKVTFYVYPFDGAATARGQLHQLTVHDEGPAVVDNSAYWSGSAAPVVTGVSYTKTYSGTTSRWWTGGGTYKGAGDNQFFGNTSSTGEGKRKTITWFDWNQIRSDIGTGTITKVELYLYLFEGGLNNTLDLGYTTSTTPGSTVYPTAPDTNRDIQSFGNWDEGTGKWVLLTAASMTNWKGTITGYVVGSGTNDSDSHAGGVRGSSHSLGPKVRITYTK